MWGMDNNFSKKMSENDPVTIVMIKGISAGAVNIILSLIFEKPTIQTSYIAFSAIIGFFCYGVSIVLFILSLRSIGTSRTSMIFSSAPFFGALVSFVVFRTWPDTIFVLAFSILAFGILILQKADFQK
jgi:drug/metabolite transporter (DMT)-like permease